MATKRENVVAHGEIDPDTSGSDGGTYDDREQLAKLGKKPVLKVRKKYKRLKTGPNNTKEITAHCSGEMHTDTRSATLASGPS